MKYSIKKSLIISGVLATLIAGVTFAAAACSPKKEIKPPMSDKTLNPNQDPEKPVLTGNAKLVSDVQVPEANVVSKEFKDTFLKLTKQEQEQDWFTNWTPSTTEQTQTNSKAAKLILSDVFTKINEKYADVRETKKQEILAPVQNLLYKATDGSDQQKQKADSWIGVEKFLQAVITAETQLLALTDADKKDEVEKTTIDPKLTVAVNFLENYSKLTDQERNDQEWFSKWDPTAKEPNTSTSTSKLMDLILQSQANLYVQYQNKDNQKIIETLKPLSDLFYKDTATTRPTQGQTQLPQKQDNWQGTKKFLDELIKAETKLMALADSTTKDEVEKTIVDTKLIVASSFLVGYSKLTEDERKKDWFKDWDPKKPSTNAGKLEQLILKTQEFLNNKYKNKEDEAKAKALKPLADLFFKDTPTSKPAQGQPKPALPEKQETWQGTKKYLDELIKAEEALSKLADKAPSSATTTS